MLKCYKCSEDLRKCSRLFIFLSSYRSFRIVTALPQFQITAKGHLTIDKGWSDTWSRAVTFCFYLLVSALTHKVRFSFLDSTPVLDLEYILSISHPNQEQDQYCLKGSWHPLCSSLLVVSWKRKTRNFTWQKQWNHVYLWQKEDSAKSIGQANREMQIKTTLKYHFTPTGLY